MMLGQYSYMQYAPIESAQPAVYVDARDDPALATLAVTTQPYVDARDDPALTSYPWIFTPSVPTTLTDEREAVDRMNELGKQVLPFLMIGGVVMLGVALLQTFKGK
jgi:hypothetical protein